MKTKTNMNLFYADQYRMMQELWKAIQTDNQIKDTRDRRNVIYRHSFAIAAVEMTTLPMAQIGGIINRDHTTVVHAMKNKEGNILYDKNFRNIYDTVSSVVAEAMSVYDETVSEYVRKKIKTANPKIDIERIIEENNKRWKAKIANSENKLQLLYRENEVLSKELKISNARVKSMNKELIRLKNLL